MNNVIVVDRNGPWRHYASAIPEGGTVLGTVTRGIGDSGALVRTRIGLYVQLNAGAVRSLPQREVRVALTQ